MQQTTSDDLMISFSVCKLSLFGFHSSKSASSSVNPRAGRQPLVSPVKERSVVPAHPSSLLTSVPDEVQRLTAGKGRGEEGCGAV